jgi:hypothetical protein
MNTDRLNHIAGRVKLCTLSRSSWSATRLHKQQTIDLNDRNHTNAGRVVVRVCEHPALKAITALHGAVYAEHVKITLPTIQDGMRLIPVTKEFEHIKIVSDAKRDHDRLVAEFLADYDKEAREAPVRLNGLYDPAAWPTHEEMSKKFDLKAHYLGCPTDGPWAQWLEESARAATDDLKEKLEDAVRRVAERCAGGKLHKSVFTSLRELIDFIPEIDISDSDELINLAKAARPLAKYDAEDLRGADEARTKVSNDANKVLDLFGAGSLS